MNWKDVTQLSKWAYSFQRPVIFPGIPLHLESYESTDVTKFTKKRLDAHKPLPGTGWGNDVWAFDRITFNQSSPAPSNIYTISDIGLWTSYALPFLLFLDSEIRKSWLDITLMYFETQSIGLNLYVWGGPAFTERIRPIIYNEGSWD